MEDIQQQVEQHFTNLWHQERRKWISGEIRPAVMKDGAPVPPQYILSTVALMLLQEDAPISNLQRAIRILKGADSHQFFYPLTSAHVTLFPCTSSMSSATAFTPIQVSAVEQVCSSIFSGISETRMQLRGLGIRGNQVFVQAFPVDRSWAQLRQHLGIRLRSVGETPSTYPDHLPVLLNIMKLTDTTPSLLLALLKIIQRLRDFDIGQLSVSTISLVLTDFVLSQPNTTHIKQYKLRKSCQ